MVKQLYVTNQNQVRLFEYFDLLFFFFCFYLETGSVLDSPDVSYLNDLHYQQHKRGRRRIESASVVDDQSTYSDDVIKILIFLFFLNSFFFFLNRLDQHHQFILLNHVN
jgi:hypothetical protein